MSRRPPSSDASAAPREPLPVDAVLPDLLRALGTAGGVVLQAPTGAGKTTRVPPALLDEGLPGEVLVLEPRRVAARAAARRIAQEQGVRLGEEVGYEVRFDRRVSARTRLRVVTEGILLRMLQDDPLLARVRAIVFDEFHERSLASDLALALAQRIRTSVRTDLQIVVMSATFDPQPIAAFLGDVPVVASAGRLFPVEIEHAPADAGVRIERSVRSAVLDVSKRSVGDILVFLPGIGEIRRCARALEDLHGVLDSDVLELHGELPPERQDAALATGGRRKIVLSTNVAETSLTLPGVRAVVDAGLERLPHVDPAVGLPRLELVRSSRESADQRAGRAGRTAPGLCVRLWSRSEDARLAPRRPPEILRADLSDAALQLYAWGERDLLHFPWFEAPASGALQAADALLSRLGALEDGRLTETGRAMVRLPAHPRLARLLSEAHTLGHGKRLALAAALLAERSPFARLAPGAAVDHDSVSDVLDAVEALEGFDATGRLDRGARTLRRGPARQILRARDQLVRALGSCPRGEDADDAILRAVLAAYPDRVARRRSSGETRAVMVGGRGVRLAAESAVHEPELFVCVDVDAGRRGERAEALVRSASGIERAWLSQRALRSEERVSFDAARKAVTGRRLTLWEDLVLEDVALQVRRGPAVERVLAAAASEDLTAALALEDDAVASLRTRVACLRAWRPELDLPDLGEERLVGLLLELVRGCRSFADLRRRPLLDHLRGALSWEQQQVLEREAPERLQVPSGSNIRLRYEAGRPPVLAVRIQEVFGLHETPRVAGGRVKVLMHLLAPNGRPQQITDDMPSFWSNTYAGVRAELRRRYPKHAWPEDPRTARAQRRPGRRR